MTEPDDKKLFEDYVYWTQKEVDCYNKGIDDAIFVIKNMGYSSPLSAPIQSPLSSSYRPYSNIISKLEALKRKP